MPAFPVYDNRGLPDGLTKREYFAINAPVEIPSWFRHVPLEQKVMEGPRLEDLVNDEDRKLAQEWSRDPCYDLPDHLKWFSDKLDQKVEADSDYRMNNYEARYFQWRRYYAEKLLTELSKPQP